MNLHLSDWEWLRVVTSLLFIWRGIQDLRDRSGTAWKTEDERKNFCCPSGACALIYDKINLLTIPHLYLPIAFAMLQPNST